MERAVLDQLADYFMRRLAGYPTTLKEDDALVYPTTLKAFLFMLFLITNRIGDQ